jgi:hypothetical protein
MAAEILKSSWKKLKIFKKDLPRNVFPGKSFFRNEICFGR